MNHFWPRPDPGLVAPISLSTDTHMTNLVFIYSKRKRVRSSRVEEEKVPKINTGVTETWPLIRVFPQAFREGLLVLLEKLIHKHLYIDTTWCWWRWSSEKLGETNNISLTFQLFLLGSNEIRYRLSSFSDDLLQKQVSLMCPIADPGSPNTAHFECLLIKHIWFRTAAQIDSNTWNGQPDLQGFHISPNSCQLS